MATIPNNVIREQRIKVEYILALYNKSVHEVKRVNPQDYMWVDIETTVSTLIPNALPRHYAFVSKASYANGPGCIEFELTEQQFMTMSTMVMAASNPLSPIGDKRFKIKCDPELKDLPNLLLSNELSEIKFVGAKLTAKTFAFDCPCGRGYFCESILKIFSKGEDLRHWGKRITRAAINAPVPFYLGVPVVGYVLYSVPIEATVRLDWNDKELKKFMTYGITEDVTIFYDDPMVKMHHVNHKVEFYMLQDQITSITEFVENATKNGIARGVPLLGDGPVAKACAGKKHTYGTNQKFLEFMKSHPDSLRVAAACFALYSLCPICYVNANPAFSLLPDLF